jgi:hypothetical protein
LRKSLLIGKLIASAFESAVSAKLCRFEKEQGTNEELSGIFSPPQYLAIVGMLETNGNDRLWKTVDQTMLVTLAQWELPRMIGTAATSCGRVAVRNYG